MESFLAAAVKQMGYGAEVGVEVLTMVVVFDILSDCLVGM
jgi:hypothetical protein